ncbi:MAG: DUF5106 domain-containing protein, partial [Alistipes sp.]|nr:DUF5106 domain-containing protein [Alistipes sp.]
MKRTIISCFLSFVIVLLVVGCGSRQGGATTSPSGSSKAETATTFIPALPPAMIPEDQRMAYMVDHYWDKFDFADTTF